MRFKLLIFIPINNFYKEMTIEANNILEAKYIGNSIFQEEFNKSEEKDGNFIIEQIS